MTERPDRFAPRSAVSAADLEPLSLAVVELDSFVDDPAPSFADLARRLARFRVSPSANDLDGGVILLGSVCLPDWLGLLGADQGAAMTIRSSQLTS
jgi:hypothetical protein